MSQLLPEGIDHLGDCPFTLHNAIRHGLRILSYEEFPIDERPPKAIWFDGDKLKAHWDAVEEERNSKYGTSSGRESAADYFKEYEQGDGTMNAAAWDMVKRG